MPVLCPTPRRYNPRSANRWLLMGTVVWALSGCDALGIDTPAKQAERKEAEAKAIGGACRHALRSIEDCHSSNPKLSKAAIFDGWRDMDQYMRENNIPAMPANHAEEASSPPTATASAHGDKTATAPEAKDDKAVAGKPGAGASAPALPGLPPKPNIVPKG